MTDDRLLNEMIQKVSWTPRDVYTVLSLSLSSIHIVSNGNRQLIPMQYA